MPHIHIGFVHFLGFFAMLVLAQFFQFLITVKFSDNPVGQAFAVLANA